MTSPAAIQGDYVDLRFVKGRKVCQVVIELPIEAGASFVAAFGTPNPSIGVPVALARIDPDAKPERKGGKLAQRAGILCGEGGFQKFLEEHSSHRVTDQVSAAHAIRTICGVVSRADLDYNEVAARTFKDLETGYKSWLTVPV